jgi:putative hydrolase of the HAD superfamily
MVRALLFIRGHSIGMNTESPATTSQEYSSSQAAALRAVIFDYGGVLTYLPDEEDWRKMASMVGAPLTCVLKAYWEHRYPYEIARYDSAIFWRLVGHDCGQPVTDALVRELVTQDNEQWGRPNPDTIALARQLKASGVPTALLSNIQPDMLSFVRGRHPWLNEFEVRVFSCQVGEAKPKAGIFLQAAERLYLRPQECLFVDDREANIEGAQRTGMQTLHFESANAFSLLRQRLARAGMINPTR